MEPDNFGSISGIDELNRYLDKYCMEFMTPDCQIDPISQCILNFTHEQLLKLTSDECYSYAFKLHSYCIYLRKELDRSIAKIDWCESIISKAVGQRWKLHSDYMKYEAKRSAIIADDTFITKVDNLSRHLTASNTQVDKKLEHVKKMADILQDLARRKAYDR